ncbi:TolC family protein [Bacteroides propionicifaciens]|uniref:TolC family protein n=1 Tax=Bacteroides propionicifaciens TaxID=392838 RepID=UPI00035C6CFC|nr:TolC family protein [Bacteroides propionicifaciens]
MCSAWAMGQNAAWSLKDCIDYAIANNIAIKQAQNKIEQNKLTKDTRKWARLPDLNASAGQNWSWGRSPSPIDNSYSDVRSMNINYSIATSAPIFTGLEIPNQYALAKLDLKASVEDLNKAKEDLSINVTSQYVQVLFNQELEGIAQQQVDLSKEQLNRGSELYKVGKLSIAELAELKSRVMQDELRHVETKNNYNLALLDLSQMLELTTPEGFSIVPMDGPLTFEPLTAPDIIYQNALLFKPQILAAQFRYQGAQKSIRIAQSGYMPKLSFNANMGSGYYYVQGRSAKNLGEQASDNLNKYIGFSLSVPIFNRFSTRNQVRNARLGLNNQLLQLENEKKILYKEIQQAWYNATAAETKHLSSQTALGASSESFLLIKEKYELGQSNNLEFNEAKVNLMKAESDNLQAKYEYLFRVKILNFYKGQMID